MPAYDPQRTRNRPTPAADRPSPVDALLDATPATHLPAGVEVEVTPGGETIVHTADADIAITASGDDVVVDTRDSRVEVRAEADEVIVEAAGEEIFVDTAPRAPMDAASWSGSPVVTTSDDGRSKLAIAIAAAVAVALAVVLLGRRRRS